MIPPRLIRFQLDFAAYPALSLVVGRWLSVRPPLATWFGWDPDMLCRLPSHLVWAAVVVVHGRGQSVSLRSPFLTRVVFTAFVPIRSFIIAYFLALLPSRWDA